MATAVAVQRKVRPDDIFFPAMALLLLILVVTGFAKTYFLPGMMFAKLPNGLVHIHGAVFVSWILLLVAQTFLAATHNLKIHMKLGVLSLALIPAMSVLGVLTLFDFIRRAEPDEGPELLLAGDLETLLIFVALTSWALLARRDAATHKRLMILGTMAIMGPAIARLNFSIGLTLAITGGLPLLVLIYDLWQTKRVHRATAVAVALTAAWVLTLAPISKLAFLHQFVEWIRHT
jgi:hypothetical protein